MSLELFSAFAERVRDHFCHDPTLPGIHLSRLNDDDDAPYYASAVRFTKKWGQGREVVASALGETMDEVIASLIKNFEDKMAGRELPKRKKGAKPTPPDPLPPAKILYI